MSFSSADREQFYSELSKLTAAGFPISRALETLLDHDLPAGQLRVVTRLDRALKAHQDLASSLEEALGDEAGDLDIALVRAGQDGGKLPESLGQLASHYGRRHRLVRTIRSQLIYPAFLLHLGVLLPSIPKIVARPSLAPLWTALLTLLGLWLLLGAGYLVLRRLNRSSAGTPRVDAFLGRIPLYGKMRRSGALTRFTDVFGFFLVAGQTVSVALRAAGSASGSGVLLATAEKAARAIEMGSNLGDAMTGKPGIPKPLARGIRTGEVSGSMDIEMERWSKLYADATEDAARNLGTWLPRIIYLFIVLVVAWQIIQMATGIYAPMFEILDQM